MLEVWPAPGWYTEIIAPLLREKGKYYAAVIAGGSGEQLHHQAACENYRRKLAARPDLYDKVIVVTLPDRWQRRRARRHARHGRDVPQHPQLDVRGMTRRRRSRRMYRALKPGGMLGVVEHRGNPAVPQDPKAKSGYVNEDYAIKLIEAQGFRLVAKSEVNANPKDTKDYAEGVWTLPPTYRAGRQGPRQVRRHRRERPLHAAVREAGPLVASPHIAQARADVHRDRRAALCCSVSPAPSAVPWKVTGSSVFCTFSVMKRLRPP